MINDSEAEELTEETNVILAGKKLRELGPKTVIIKKGEHGAILFHEDGSFALPAYPVTNLRDPTGAGDSFAGARLADLPRGIAPTFPPSKKLFFTVHVLQVLRLKHLAVTVLNQLEPLRSSKEWKSLKNLFR